MTNQLPAVIDDGFSEMAKDSPATDPVLVGSPIKFTHRLFPIGRGEGDATGMELAAYRTGRVWQKWDGNNRLVDQIPEQPGVPFPLSVEDIKDDGSVLGEWKLARLLYLRDLKTGRDFTFYSSTEGGRRALNTLAA